MIDITTYNEFGFILWYYAPIAYDLHIKNKLGRTFSKVGSSAVFYFSNNHKECALHSEVFNNRSECYKHQAPEFTKQNWTPPPLKEYYKNTNITFDKPILTINNKNNMEWGNSGIFNYFDADSLEAIFEKFSEQYKIIYIRPVNNNAYKYQKDEGQNEIDIGDLDLIKNKYPNVLWIGDILKQNPNLSYNEVQFMILANSNMHISCSGDAVIPAYFDGDVLIYTHPNCTSTKRGIWKTGSWLKLLSNANIYGYINHKMLLDKAIELWK